MIAGDEGTKVCMFQENLETVALGKPKFQSCGACVNYSCFHRANNNENP